MCVRVCVCVCVCDMQGLQPGDRLQGGNRVNRVFLYQGAEVAMISNRLTEEGRQQALRFVGSLISPETSWKLVLDPTTG